MNKDRIIFFTIGLVSGIGGTYFGMKKYFNDREDSVVKETKTYYENKYKEAIEAENEPKIDEKPEISGEKQVNEPSEEPNYNEIINKLNYNQYSTKPNKKVEEYPYIISDDQYDNDGNFSKYLMSYFSEDEVLINAQTDEVIQDVDRIIGINNLEQITDTETDEICVRNEVEGADYKIILEDGSYEDYIAGEL